MALQILGQAEEAQVSSEGEMREVKRTKPTEKAKEKVMEEKVSMKTKDEKFGSKGRQQGTRLTKDEALEEQGRVAPNVGAGGSHPQAMSDLAESEEKGDVAESEQQRNEEEILKLLRGWQKTEATPVVRWAWADDSNERQEEPVGEEDELRRKVREEQENREEES